jgi:uncharacterized protein YndB with AHSA1/START domain
MVDNPVQKKPQISDESVRAATGKAWEEWFAILDAAGGRELSHQEIVAHLHQVHGVRSWWQQMVTVTYEQHTGRRQKHEMPDGYQVSRSRTFPVPRSELWAAWNDASARGAWLFESSLELRGATPEKSIRFKRTDGSSVEARFAIKGEARSQVTVEHNRLPGREQADEMKAFWAEMLDRLEKYLSRSPL